MKRILALCLSMLMMILPLFSCGKRNEDGGNTTAQDTTAQNQPPQAFDASAVAASTANSQISAGMMQYFFMSIYNTFVYNNSSYLSYYGLDTTKSLKEQTVSGSEETWFSYFLEQTKTMSEELLVTADKARENQLSLTEEDEKSLRDYIDLLQKNADSQKVTLDEYIAQLYGEGVGVDVVREAIELQLLSSAYYRVLQENASLTDEEYEAYYAENKATLAYADYMTVTLSAELPTEISDEEEARRLAEIEKKINRLAACKDASSFRTLAEQYLRETITDETRLKAAIDGMEITHASASQSSSWLFEDGRVLYDSTTVKNRDGYTIYFQTRLPYREESPARHVRHILVLTSDEVTEEEAKKRAEEILAEWKSGEMTEDSFAALAKKESEDSSASRGGLYSNVCLGQMVENFEDWLFDETRKVGDTGIVSSTYGYHVMYYVGEGAPQWKAMAESGAWNKKYAGMIEELAQQNPVTYNDAVLNSLHA